MERITRGQRDIIRQLHQRNEEFFDKGTIGFDEYIFNNHLLLRKVRYSVLTYEQKIAFIESINDSISLNKFRLSIKIAQIGFN